MIRAFLFSVTLVIGISAMAAPQASTPPVSSTQTITRDSRYIYTRTSWKNMSSSMRSQVFRSSTVLLAKQLKTLREKGVLPKELTSESLGALKQAHAEIDKLISAVETSALNRVQDDKSLARFVPAGLFITVGGKASLQLKVGGGASVSMGLVLVPTYVQRQAIVLEEGMPEFESYVEFQIALIAWPNAQLSAGAGASVGLRVGLGLIWGDLDRPQDFIGPLVGFSQSLGAGAVGFGVKAGALHNNKRAGFFQYPFVMATYDTGLITTAEANFNMAWVMEGAKILEVLGFDPSMVPETERVPVESPRMMPANDNLLLTQP